MNMQKLLTIFVLFAGMPCSFGAETAGKKYQTIPVRLAAGMPLESAMKSFPLKRNAPLHLRQMQAAGAVTDSMIVSQIYYELNDGGWVSLICTKPDSRAGKSTSPFAGMYVIGPITISGKIPPAPKSLSIPLKLATDEILRPVPVKVKKNPSPKKSTPG